MDNGLRFKFNAHLPGGSNWGRRAPFCRTSFRTANCYHNGRIVRMLRRGTRLLRGTEHAHDPDLPVLKLSLERIERHRRQTDITDGAVQGLGSQFDPDVFCGRIAQILD